MTIPTTPSQKPIKPLVGKNVLSIFGIVSSIALALFLLMAFIVSESGFIHVPVFSRFYKGPTPIRIVQSKPMDETAFKVLLSERFFEQLKKNNPPFRFKIYDAELTGALVSVIDLALRDQAWKALAVQMASTPEYLELYGRFQRGFVHSDVRLRLKVIVEDGGVRFDVTDFRFGDFPVHPSLAGRFAGVIFSRDLGIWKLKFGDIEIQEANPGNGYLELVSSP
jgi:hypothetical protein